VQPDYIDPVPIHYGTQGNGGVRLQPIPEKSEAGSFCALSIRDTHPLTISVSGSFWARLR
jgi:hypothetical protein